MKKYLAKDLKLREGFSHMESNYLVLKALTLSQRVSIVERIYFQSLLLEYKFKTKVKIKNRCNITGRARSVYRYFGANRMFVKENSALGLFSRVKNSS
jgi:ribosomal protein S14